jgi:hypothetical protein
MQHSHRRGFGPAWVIFCAFFTFAAMAFAGTYSGGSGTAEAPYQISTVADWQELTADPNNWDQHFILTNDIDFAGIILTPVAPDVSFQGGYPGTAFQGILNGNGHVMSNIMIKSLGLYSVGLFGNIGSDGLIQDVTIKTITIQPFRLTNGVGGLAGSNEGTIASCHLNDAVVGPAGSSEGYAWGGLVGNNLEEGTIIGCSATGTVNGWDCIGGLVGSNEGEIISCHTDNIVTGDAHVGGLIGINDQRRNHRVVADCHSISSVVGHNEIGGLVGDNFYATVTGCSAMGRVDGSRRVGGLIGVNLESITTACFATGDVTGDAGICVGGLVGDNLSSTITFSYASGTVYGINDHIYIGGLAGYHSGTISNCYSRGTVIDGGGGLCGFYDKGTITGSFWDIENSGKTSSSGGTGKTTAEMKTQATFTDAGWDFVGEEANGTADVWRMCGDGVEYPHLAWEFSQHGDIACPDGIGLDDLAYLAGRWMQTTITDAGAADSDRDGIVGLSDFAVVSDNWMKDFSDSHLIVHLTMDGDFADSATGFSSTVIGDPAFVDEAQARVGNGAVELDGDDAVVIDRFLGITGRNERTCTAWIKTTTDGPILYWGDKRFAGPGKWNLRIRGGKLFLSTGQGWSEGVSAVNTGQWVHIAIVLPEGRYDAKDVQFYVNGLLESGGAMGPGVIETRAWTRMQIGTDEFNYFTGLIDDVRIYDRALTAAEIAGLAGG